MTVWVVRGGKDGGFEEEFIRQNLAGIDYGLRQSALGFDSRESLGHFTPDRHAASQIWNFTHEIRVGDMVVLPRKRTRVIRVGRVSGDYVYREGLEPPHVRAVEWENLEIPRSDFDQDLLNSFGGLVTVFRVRAGNAEARIDSIIAGNLDSDTQADPVPDHQANIDNEEFKLDLEEQINDRIVERIRQRFSGTRLETLVAEILRASGYHALETRPGPDGGIDVLAGQGDMGFGQPRLCVQVKSGRNAVDLPDYNRLQGNIGSFGAEHGLLVSLGDFTRAVRNENERSFFQIRLWGPNDLVEKLLETYDSLPDEIQSEIPLRNRRILIEMEQ